MNGNIPRKHFITLVGYLVMALFGGLWLGLTRKSMLSAPSSRLFLDPEEVAQGTTFYEDMIAFRSGQDIRLFSTRCSHLGCRISREENGRLICPCHGSEYDPASGMVLKGPSIKPLKELSYTLEAGRIVVEMPTL